MAKISANGATKVAELRVKSHNDHYELVFVMCSDGRILRRYAGSNGGGYTVDKRVSKSQCTMDILRQYVTRLGYEVKS